MKKLLSICMTVFLIFSSALFALPSYAEETEIIEIDADKASILKDLGILEDTFGSETIITRMQFLRSVCAITTENELSDIDAFELARGYKLTSAENYEEFDPERTIKYNEAVKMLVTVAGYGLLAENKGGYPGGYTIAANRADIVNGTSGDEDILTPSSAVILLYNTILTNVMAEGSFSADGADYEIYDDSVIYYYRGLYTIEDVMTANSVTSLNNPNDGGVNTVMIGKTTLRSYIDKADKYLGYPVIGFVDKDNVLVAVGLNTGEYNEIIISDDDEPQIDDKISTLTYYEKDGKEEEIKLSTTLDVIYNGKALPNYQKEDLIPANGQILLIDTNTDKKYDVLSVTDYQLFYVSHASSSAKMIYNQFNETLLEYLNLEGSLVTYSFFSGDKAVKIGEIKRDDVLEVAVSASGSDVLVSGIVTKDAVSGNISSKSKDKFELAVAQGEDADGNVTYIYTEYEYNPLYLIEKNGTDDVKSGTMATVYLDSRGRAAYVKCELTSFYAYVTGIDAGSGLKAGKMKYINEAAEWNIAQFADAVKYNNTKISGSEVFGKLNGTGGFKRKLMRLKLNSEGQITEILLPGIDTEGDDRFVLSSTITGIWHPQNGSIGNWELYLESSAPVFLVPADADGDDDEYDVISPGELNGTNTVEGYNVNEYSMSNLAVAYSSGTDITGYNWFIVTRKTRVVLSDGTETVRLYSEMGNDETNTCVAKDPELFANVDVGDILLFSVNRQGRVTAMEMIHDFSEGVAYATGSSNHGGDVINKATLISADPASNMLLLDKGTTFAASLPKGELMEIYDAEAEKLIKGTISDLKPGDFIVMQHDWSDLDVIKVIRY